MTPINLADLERWAAAKDAFPTLAGAAQAILEAPAIQWCKTHDAAVHLPRPEVEPRCDVWVLAGVDGWETTDLCVVVSARVVEVSE